LPGEVDAVEESALIFKAILDADPVPAVRLNPDIPAELERILNKALEKDRDLCCFSLASFHSQYHAAIARVAIHTDSAGLRPCCLRFPGETRRYFLRIFSVTANACVYFSPQTRLSSCNTPQVGP
jgi:hypothetical protein